MRILTRYVLSELLKVFLLTLGVMTLLMFIVLLGKQAIEVGLGLGGLLQLTPYILPNALQFTLPGALLLATTAVYGRVASSNELVAIKSLGISPLIFVWPALVLSVVVSFAAVWLNDIAVSWGRLGQERVILESMEAIAYNQLRNKSSYSHGKITVSVLDVDGRTLRGITLTKGKKGEANDVAVTADAAQFHADIASSQLILEMENAVLETPDGEVLYPGISEHVIPLDQLMGSRKRSRSPSNYALAEIGPAKQVEHDRISQVRQEISSRAAFAMLTGDFEQLSDEAWKPQQRALQHAGNRLNRFYTEPYRRWSNGFSCLAFAAVGIPVAVMLRKDEMLASFFACFLPILIVYYPMFMLAMVFAKKGVWHPQTVWIGNLVLLICGFYLMRREARH